MTDPIAWPYPWGGEFVEQLAWATDVLSAPTGNTQHRRLLTAPRVTVSFDALLDADQRRALETTLRSGAGRVWWAPVLVDACTLTSAVSAAGTSLPCAPGIARIPAGSSVMLVDGDNVSYEIAEVDTAGESSITLADGLDSDWPAGTRVVPLRLARFASPPQVTRFTGDATDILAITFALIEALESAAAFATTYRSIPVFDFEPNWFGPPAWTPDRLVQIVDYGLAAPVVSDIAGVPLGSTAMKYTLIGADEVAAFRSALFALAGRWSPAWVPTWAQDVRVVAATPVGETHIDIAGPLLADETLFANRRDLRIALADGSAIHARIASATDIGGGVERLELDHTFASGLAVADVAAVSFLVLSMQSADVNVLRYFKPDVVDSDITWVELAHEL